MNNLAMNLDTRANIAATISVTRGVPLSGGIRHTFLSNLVVCQTAFCQGGGRKLSPGEANSFRSTYYYKKRNNGGGGINLFLWEIVVE